MQNMINILRKNNIENPPWDYYFLQNLDEKEYPKYLSKIFKYRTGEKLYLKFDFKNKSWVIDKNKCKTFNQKIQWIKLYGVTDLMRNCTDKVAVRDYVKEKIGDEYLKPVLQICDSFEEIDYKKLPNSFVLKCNHGCKWQYIVRNKEEFLNNKELFETVKRNITGWLEQEFWCWGGFEMQYKSIEPKILIESFLQNNDSSQCEEINIYCFSETPKIAIRFENKNNRATTLYDENQNIINDTLSANDINIKTSADNLLDYAFILSKKLSSNFNFVRVDWMIFNNKLCFEELTFTPYSGLKQELNIKFNKYFGKMINLERN